MSNAREKTQEVVRTILATVHRRTGVDFSSYRPATIHRRIANRMTAIGVETFDEYLQLLERSEAETLPLIERMTIKVSRFYRNPVTFDRLRQQVIPELVQARKEAPLRIWSAGCGHGEEACTLAMLLDETGAAGVVEATDVDPMALQVAGAAVYSADATSDLPADLAARYLEPCDHGGKTGYRVRDAVRDRVRYSYHDITAGAPLPSGGAFDLISCRNLLIYLERSVQTAAVEYLRLALVPGGFLCLGEAEWPPLSATLSLEPLDYQTRIFRALDLPDGEPA